MHKDRTKQVSYHIQINGEFVFNANTLIEAKHYIKENSNSFGGPQVIEIVKVATVQTVVKTYIPQTVTTFVEADANKEDFETGLSIA
jgi:hypothetical protein